jgi:rRNA maturation endonuclease Nob1
MRELKLAGKERISIYDTSALDTVPDGSIYVTPGARQEIEYLQKSGRISQKVLENMHILDKQPAEALQTQIKKRAYDKGKVKDPISDTDIKTIGTAVELAQAGYPVDVHSKDAHITETLHEMLGSDYKHLATRIMLAA